MKRMIIASVALMACGYGVAMAACESNTRVTGSALTTLVSGNTVCATSGSDSWQEQHRAGGQLWDYKMGASDPIDPTKQVGSWSIASNQVTYSYTNGPSYTYYINQPTANVNLYDFCNTSGTLVVTGATFKTGNASCP